MGHVRYIVLVCVAALALAPAAMAGGGGATQQYKGLGGNVQSQIQKVGKQRAGVAGLPFTGLDLALMVGGGLALVLAGGTIRRLSTRRA